MKKPAPAAAAAAPAPEPVNRDLMHLSYAETRLNGLKVNAPGSTELARIQAAREDILSRISAKDLAAYRKAATQKMTPEQRAEEADKRAAE